MVSRFGLAPFVVWRNGRLWSGSRPWLGLPQKSFADRRANDRITAETFADGKDGRWQSNGAELSGAELSGAELSGRVPNLGHLRLGVEDVAAARNFLELLGMRVFRDLESRAIMELKDGTHLVLHEADSEIPAGTALQFDLVIDDLDAAWADYHAKGLNPSQITRGRAHDSFTIPGPNPYRVTVNSPFRGDQGG